MRLCAFVAGLASFALIVPGALGADSIERRVEVERRNDLIVESGELAKFILDLAIEQNNMGADETDEYAGWRAINAVASEMGLSDSKKRAYVAAKGDFHFPSKKDVSAAKKWTREHQ
ncbi:hypothetical protein F4779DRAFT_612832 [Xylariaceae sp. FL0662B]|nr:hypothetical protein F4779DRAFT_612832 [Xylariaceae sp. FL0662B]